jgi:hypothetical protein
MALLVTMLVSSTSLAADNWTDPYPGIRQLHRTIPGQNIHASVVDLSRPELYIRATRRSERQRTTTSFANLVGAAVAINGDLFNYNDYLTVGLAVGAGEHWAGTADQGWSFIACTVEKDCVFDNHPTDTPLNNRWHDVVGGNGWRLLIDGQIPTYPPDSYYTTREPRSAVGVSQDGNTMIFMVVQGRRSDSNGMTFPETAEHLRSLGAHQGLMLDGGGSSALVIGGSRVSALPSGASERVVANHLAIVGGIPDGRCNATPNGRYCDGSVIHTCQGNQHMGEGDCAAFGASCEVTADGVGVCSHFKCKNGPSGTFCDSDTVIGTCAYGQPSYGDCAAFGTTCEESGGEAYCVLPECTEGGNTTWCKDDTTLGSCTRGRPDADVDCAASAMACRDGQCVDLDCSDCDAGAPDTSVTDTSAGDADPAADSATSDSSTGSDIDGPTDAVGSDDATTQQSGRTSTQSCACRHNGGAPVGAGWLLIAAALGLGVRLRRF